MFGGRRPSSPTVCLRLDRMTTSSPSPHMFMSKVSPRGIHQKSLCPVTCNILHYLWLFLIIFGTFVGHLGENTLAQCAAGTTHALSAYWFCLVFILFFICQPVPVFSRSYFLMELKSRHVRFKKLIEASAISLSQLLGSPSPHSERLLFSLS